MTAFSASRVETGEASIDVRVFGAGPTLVMLPGLGRSSHDLDAFAVALASAGHRAVLPEPRLPGRELPVRRERLPDALPLRSPPSWSGL